MKVFLSHSSMNKTNVKAIVSYLPKQMQTWLDENNLVWGSPLEETFESVIKTEMDYVIVFLSGSRQSNVWVTKELNWALERQKSVNRCFVLPVIMPSLEGDPYQEYPEINNIKYIKLDNYEETGFKSCAERITAQLFSLIINDLDNMHKPKNVPVSKVIKDANSFLDEFRQKVYKIVFKHREHNPISVDELYNELSHKFEVKLSYDDFPDLLNKVCATLSGVYFDGYVLYLTEEHSQWKQNVSAESKKAIAYVASRHIRSGQSVFIDAGSTMSFLIDIICKRIESHTLSGLKLILISTEHANKIADICAALGCDQYNSPAIIYLPGGMVRANTKAIVGIDGHDSLEAIVNHLRKIDVAFIGANGADSDSGIYTHDNEELYTKQRIAEISKSVYYTFDDSKCGIILDSKLADFSDVNVRAIINENPQNEELQKILDKYGDRIELAKALAK